MKDQRKGRKEEEGKGEGNETGKGKRGVGELKKEGENGVSLCERTRSTREVARATSRETATDTTLLQDYRRQHRGLALSTN